MININTIDDERLYSEYLIARNKPQLTIKNGIYPNVIKVLQEYDDLIYELTKGKYVSFMEYHEDITHNFEPLVQNLYDTLQQIESIIVIMNQYQPGIFISNEREIENENKTNI